LTEFGHRAQEAPNERLALLAGPMFLTPPGPECTRLYGIKTVQSIPPQIPRIRAFLPSRPRPFRPCVLYRADLRSACDPQFYSEAPILAQSCTSPASLRISCQGGRRIRAICLLRSPWSVCAGARKPFFGALKRGVEFFGGGVQCAQVNFFCCRC
jgi:hypothetical protein